MADEYSVVDVWAGRFESREELDAYMEETYSGEPEDDDQPISKFAEGQSETFYDTDFLEINFSESDTNFESLLQDMSFAESFKAPAEAAFRADPVEKVNTVILSWAQQFEAPKSVQGDVYRLAYLGQFPCNAE